MSDGKPLAIVTSQPKKQQINALSSNIVASGGGAAALAATGGSGGANKSHHQQITSSSAAAAMPIAATSTATYHNNNSVTGVADALSTFGSMASAAGTFAASMASSAATGIQRGLQSSQQQQTFPAQKLHAIDSDDSSSGNNNSEDDYGELLKNAQKIAVAYEKAKQEIEELKKTQAIQNEKIQTLTDQMLEAAGDSLEVERLQDELGKEVDATLTALERRQRLRQHTAQRKKALKATENKLDTLLDQTDEANQALERAEQAILKFNHQRVKEQNRVHQIEQRITNQEQQIEVLKAQLVEKEKRAEEIQQQHQNQVANLTQIAHTQHDEIKERENLILALRDQITTIRNELTTLANQRTADVEQRDREIATLRADNQDLQTRLTASQSQIVPFVAPAVPAPGNHPNALALLPPAPPPSPPSGPPSPPHPHPHPGGAAGGDNGLADQERNEYRARIHQLQDEKHELEGRIQMLEAIHTNRILRAQQGLREQIQELQQRIAQLTTQNNQLHQDLLLHQQQQVIPLIPLVPPPPPPPTPVPDNNSVQLQRDVETARADLRYEKERTRLLRENIEHVNRDLVVARERIEELTRELHDTKNDNEQFQHQITNAARPEIQKLEDQLKQFREELQVRVNQIDDLRKEAKTREALMKQDQETLRKQERLIQDHQRRIREQADEILRLAATPSPLPLPPPPPPHPHSHPSPSPSSLSLPSPLPNNTIAAEAEFRAKLVEVTAYKARIEQENNELKADCVRYRDRLSQLENQVIGKQRLQEEVNKLQDQLNHLLLDYHALKDENRRLQEQLLHPSALATTASPSSSPSPPHHPIITKKNGRMLSLPPPLGPRPLKYIPSSSHSPRKSPLGSSPPITAKEREVGGGKGAEKSELATSLANVLYPLPPMIEATTEDNDKRTLYELVSSLDPPISFQERVLASF